MRFRLIGLVVFAATAWCGNYCASVPLLPSSSPPFQGDQKYKDLYGNRVFRLYSDPNGGDAAQGTGFLVDAQSPFVLTVAHLIPETTFPKSDSIVGQIALFPELTFHFSVAHSFCEQIFQEECQDDSGKSKGKDVAVLKMRDDDFQIYQQTVGRSAPAFVVMLGPNPPAIVYSLGFQGQDRTTVGTPPPRLDPLTTTVTADPTFSDPSDPNDPIDPAQFIWRLSNPILGGRSGSPLFDADGRVFGIVTREDTSQLHYGLAVNLGSFSNDLVDLKFVFDSIPLSKTASNLETKILGNSYSSDAQIGRDLSPALVTNNEIVSVAFGIQSVAASYKFKACVDSAIVSRNLGSLLDFLYPTGAVLGTQAGAVIELQKATGLAAAGRAQAAALAYADAYKQTVNDQSPLHDARIAMTAALGAAKAYLQMNDPGMAKTYSTLALQKANAESTKSGPLKYLRDFAALANSYLFELAQGERADPKKAATYARSAFKQVPDPVFDLYSTVPEKEKFRIHSNDLGAEKWAEPIDAIKTTLEPRLLGLKPMT